MSSYIYLVILTYKFTAMFISLCIKYPKKNITCTIMDSSILGQKKNISLYTLVAFAYMVVVCLGYNTGQRGGDLVESYTCNLLSKTDFIVLPNMRNPE